MQVTVPKQQENVRLMGLLREFSFNSAVANLVKQYLVEEGLHVFFAHNEREDVHFTERTKRANRLSVDAFVSIHANAFGGDWNNANGIETFVYPTASKESVDTRLSHSKVHSYPHVIEQIVV